MLQTALISTPHGLKTVLYSSIYYSQDHSSGMPYESFSPRIPPPGAPRRNSSSLSGHHGFPPEPKMLKAGAVAVLVTSSGNFSLFAFSLAVYHRSATLRNHFPCFRCISYPLNSPKLFAFVDVENTKTHSVVSYRRC